MGPLKDITNALNNLMRNESNSSEDESSTEDHPEYFCVEDTLLTSDVKVSVPDIGTLEFPLSGEMVEKLITISSKAQFGRGESTVLDTSVRDTQMIPASKLNVEIREEAFNDALERISCGLNIKSGTLVPHLYNMLIYRQGQFFKMHSDSPKEKNMVATLVIVLPSAHKGGDLIIHHNNKQHIFFGSKNPNFVKCVAFYSDCQHEIKKVTEGFRVALTFNVILNPSHSIAHCINVDERLNDAVRTYFTGRNRPTKLVFLLNHSYSENNLKWELLKGTDRDAALSLYVVAHHQSRVPCLALAKYKETCEYPDGDVIDTETVLDFWVDDNNLKMSEKDVNVGDEEVCYTMETTELFEPYDTEYSGPTGNAGETSDNWYQRACVVLWSSKWDFFTGYNLALNELHTLTTSAGNENTILEVIDKAGSAFRNAEFWKNEEVSLKLIDIAMYLNNPAKAVMVLSKFPNTLLDPNHIERLLLLEKQYDRDTWKNIMTSWKGCGWSATIEKATLFIQKYTEQAGAGQAEESFIVDFVLEEAVNKFMKTDHRPIKYSNPYYPWYGSSASHKQELYLYDRTDNKVIEQVLKFLQIFVDLKKKSLQEKLTKYVVSSTVFTPLSVAEMFFKLKEKFNQNQFPFLKLMKDSAVMKVNSQIPQIAKCSNNWFFDIKISCSCRFCAPVQAFFHSKTQQSVVIPAGKDNRRHVYSQLNPLTSYPIKFHTERTGNPFKIIIEKESNVPKDREKILRDLLKLKEKLDEVDIENGNGETVRASTSESQMNPETAIQTSTSTSQNEEIPNKRSRLNNE